MTLRQIFQLATLTLTLSASSTLLAQRWELGAGAAGTFYNSKEVSVGSLKANAGFKSGWGATGWIGNDISNLVSGEIRYMYQANDLKLESGGTTYTFGAKSHSIHYDFLLHGAPRNAKVRPFVAFGAGMRGYVGTGREVALQPLSNFAFLTKTSEWVPLVSLGAGIKFIPSKRVAFRAEFRDYLSPVPSQVLTAAPGAKISGWYQNFVALFGVSLLF